MVTYRFHCLCETFYPLCLQYRNFLCSEHQNHRNLYTKVPRYPQVSVSFVRKDPADQHNKDPSCYKHSENTSVSFLSVIISVILWYGSFPPGDSGHGRLPDLIDVTLGFTAPVFLYRDLTDRERLTDNRTGYPFSDAVFRMQISGLLLCSEPLAYSGCIFALFLRLSVSPAVWIPAQDFYVPDGSHHIQLTFVLASCLAALLGFGMDFGTGLSSTGFSFHELPLFSICRSIPVSSVLPEISQGLISFFCIISTGFKITEPASPASTGGGGVSPDILLVRCVFISLYVISCFSKIQKRGSHDSSVYITPGQI